MFVDNVYKVAEVDCGRS